MANRTSARRTRAKNRGRPDPIAPLLARMTLDEKIGQLNQLNAFSKDVARQIRAGRVGSLLNLRDSETINTAQRIAMEQSRLKIPLLIGNDVIHGYRTTFPIPLGEAASWDPKLAERAARVAAREAAAAGTRWTFAPMVDIARDPRWGRIAEGAGEDTFLGSAFARARVRGFQGEGDPGPESVAACAKHYVAYGAAEGGRDYNTVDISISSLRETYLPPFKAALDAGALTFMSAFNDLNGVPATANRYTLTQILREEWGFAGFVVSDWNSITELVNHGLAADRAEAARLSLLAGVDMDMVGYAYISHLKKLVRSGKVPLKAVDAAVRRILEVKFRLGLFANPYADRELERRVTLCPAHLDLAREAARSSLVLLRNEKSALPLSRDLRTLAVIGPMADNRSDMLGTWNCEGKPEEVVTVLEGIRRSVSERTKIVYAKGCEIESSRDEDISAAVKAAARADAVVLAVGEEHLMSGEGGCRTEIGLPGHQEQLVRAIRSLQVPMVAVLFAGRPLAIPWMAENVPAILLAWHPGTQCGNAVADVLFGEYSPSGRLPVSFPRRVGQIPVYHSQKSTGRPPRPEERTTSKYLDLPNTPQFPFGFGLSYTSFSYANLRIFPRRIGKGSRAAVSVEVTNGGRRPGEEVVQLYIGDVAASRTRPYKELKGFEKIALNPGEKRRVAFSIGPELLGFPGDDGSWVLEPGSFRIWVGPSSAEGLAGSLELTAR